MTTVRLLLLRFGVVVTLVVILLGSMRVAVALRLCQKGSLLSRLVVTALAIVSVVNILA